MLNQVLPHNYFRGELSALDEGPVFVVADEMTAKTLHTVAFDSLGKVDDFGIMYTDEFMCNAKAAVNALMHKTFPFPNAKPRYRMELVDDDTVNGRYLITLEAYGVQRQFYINTASL